MALHTILAQATSQYPYPSTTPFNYNSFLPNYSFDFFIPFISSFNGSGISEFLLIFKLFSLFISLIFGGILLYYLTKIQELFAEPASRAVVTKRMYDAEWAQIKNYVNSQTASEWKLAVIEADKVVDDALKHAGFGGETMGERLMLIQPSEFPFLQDLWDAHKLRNFLVHDITATLAHDRAQHAVDIFEKTMRALQVLS